MQNWANHTNLSVGTGIALVAGVAVGWTFIVPAEDAFILYEYSRNLASQGVITFGGADVPIEGATDFLFMVTTALLLLVGVEEHLGSLILSACAAGLLSREISRTSGALVAAAALLATPFMQAALAGFSALIFSAVFVLCLKYFLERSTRAFYLTVLVLCLIRPDGVVWAGGVCGVALWRALRERRSAELREALLWLVMPGAVYFFARAAYFGEWMPLPFYVKAAGSRDIGSFFTGSFAAVFAVAGSALVAAIVAWRRETVQSVAMVVIIPTVFFLSMQLEQNVGNRFLAPMFFGVAYLLGRQNRRVAQVFVAMVVVVSARTTLNAVHWNLDSRQETVVPLAKALGDLHGKLLTTEAGRLTYYSRWQTHDSWGLNTPKYTRNLITVADLQSEQYDLIVAHCALDMLVEPGRRDGVRSWNDMCAAMTDHIHTTPHDVFLVRSHRRPRTRTLIERALGRSPTDCRQVHIYAVRASSTIRTDIERRLMAHGAIPFSGVVPDDPACNRSPN